MTAIIVLVLMLALALVAPRYGADSRQLRDHSRTVPRSARRPGW